MFYTTEPQLGNLRLLNTLGTRIWHLSPSDASKSPKKMLLLDIRDLGRCPLCLHDWLFLECWKIEQAFIFHRSYWEVLKLVPNLEDHQ